MQREIIFYILFSLASKTHQKIEFKILLLVHIGCHKDRDWRDVDDDDIWSIQSGRKIGFFFRKIFTGVSFLATPIPTTPMKYIVSL